MSLRHRKAPGLPLGVQAARLKLPKTRLFRHLLPTEAKHGSGREKMTPLGTMLFWLAVPGAVASVVTTLGLFHIWRTKCYV
jgi:hypothetical protein